ncbi:MAG: hypothetical protein U0L22_04500 [Bacteroidales bacterium]|nr:hypothetical protein [Bacteroidales bacterium]
MSKADNKIRIIDLLNKIANGEEAPKEIKFDKEVFVYIGKWQQYVTKEEEIPLLRRISDYNYSGLNDEVEILEDNTEEIEELKRTENVYDMTLECYHDIEKEISNDELADKINEIIRYIKRKDKSND